MDMTHTSFLDAIRQRRSIRQYRPEPVARELLETLLNTAIWAPSAHNRQPWRFAVVQQISRKEQLANAMGARLRRDLEADGLPAEMIAKDVGRSVERMTSAPVLILVCLSLVDMDVYPDPIRMHNEYVMAVQSTAMAGQNLLLAAHEVGLGACWMCAPLFCPDVVRENLDLPEDWQPQGVVALGYPAQERTKTRHPLEKSVLWR
jgi:coenzyme F420-0:L-glutamate ligase / coenzyme F420-1:gamma-L-glutamate ligase